MSARESRPGTIAEAAKESGQAQHQDTRNASIRRYAERTRDEVQQLPYQLTSNGNCTRCENVAQVDWAMLAHGSLSLDSLRQHCPPLFEFYTLGYSHGAEALSVEIRQLQHENDRLYLRAMNDKDRAKTLEIRLDRAIAACPENIELHSREYFEWAMAHVFLDRSVTLS